MNHDLSISTSAPSRLANGRRFVGAGVVCAALLFAGCGSDDNGANNDIPTSVVSGDESGGADSESPDLDEGVTDAGGDAVGDEAADPIGDEPGDDLPSESEGIDPAAGGSTFNPVAGEWRLKHATLEGDMAIVVPEGNEPTMTIQGLSLTAFFGCNSGGGTVQYDIASDAFSVEELSQTLMACDDEMATQIESAVSRVLQDATTFTSEPGLLTISDGAEYPSELTFEIIPAPDTGD